MTKSTKDGTYFCTVWNEADGEVVCLSKRSRSRRTRRVRNEEGQESSVPVNCLVGLERALIAARTYAVSGTAATELMWEPIEDVFR